jgi:hypothetical protein
MESSPMLCKQRVTGSIPVTSTNHLPANHDDHAQGVHACQRERTEATPSISLEINCSQMFPSLPNSGKGPINQVIATKTGPESSA